MGCLHLLWRHVVGLSPHINLLVDIHARDHKEDARAPGSARQEQSQSKYDGSLVLLDHLDDEAQREGESGQHQQEGAEDQQVGTQTLGLLTR